MVGVKKGHNTQDRELAFHQLTGGLEIKGARDEFHKEDLAENGAVPLFPHRCDRQLSLWGSLSLNVSEIGAGSGIGTDTWGTTVL